MARLRSADFYIVGDELPLQQGDILLAPVVRVDTGHTRNHWRPLDEEAAILVVPQPGREAVAVAGGWALVMVTTHDCGLDKEFNAKLGQLEAAGTEITQEVEAEVEDNESLDRFLQVSPLVHPADVQVAGVQVPQDQLLGGKSVGYLPVPPLSIGDTEVVPESVVDLNYRCTIDRLACAARVSSVSEAARTQLRYALARLDALRTPTLEFELADVVGKTVSTARVAKKNPLAVELVFSDGKRVQLLQPPGSPKPGGPARTARSATSG
jgi:hypothetical protein